MSQPGAPPPPSTAPPTSRVQFASPPAQSTRSTGRTATDPLSILGYVLSNVLQAGIDADNVYRLIFESSGVQSITDVLMLEENDIDTLTMQDSNGDIVEASLTNKRAILWLRDYAATFPSDQSEVYWMSTTAATYNAFRRRHVATLSALRTMPTTTTVTVPTTTTTSPADEFQKGTRRSVSDYKPFREKRQWNQWNRMLVSTGTDHGIENVFDQNYVPGNQAERDLFMRVKKFAMSVFTSTLMEAESLTILRRYSDPNDNTRYGDAQALYADLVATMTTGAPGRALVRMLEDDLATLRLDRQWPKTISLFVTKVSHLISDHQGLVDRTHYPDSYYITKLDECLSTNREMRSYITTLKTQSEAIARATRTAPREPTYLKHLYDVQQHATVVGRHISV